jgi:hypothetical protein
MAGRCFRVSRFADLLDSTMIRTGRDGEGRRRLTILSACGLTGILMFAAGIGPCVPWPTGWPWEPTDAARALPSRHAPGLALIWSRGPSRANRAYRFSRSTNSLRNFATFGATTTWQYG